MIMRDRASASGDAAVSIAGDSHAPVTTTYVGTQVVGASSMPLSAAAKDPGVVFAAVHLEAFTGRQWLADEVDRFIAGHPCGYVLIEAAAGVGKTAFAAWLVKTRGFVSHFSRHSGGGSVQVALANLAAQLIRNFGLDGEAPGGMLPEWCQTPSGFESLLATAAGRAREQRRALILVVDGLDEADTPVDGLPFGLPSLLPDSVYVIGTYRTGRSPGWPHAPATTLRIAREDQRNQDDIRAYLAKTVGDDVLAARLAEADIDHKELIELLAKRCGGVWVYLRYVIDELRFGLRRPTEIGELPTGLRGYYADQIRRWRADPSWRTGLLPFLATLSVAGEALPASSLARLAGNPDRIAVQRWCDLTVRPLLTTTRAQAGAPLQYEIYHASFREVLNPGPEDTADSSADQPAYELIALSEELRQAAATAHNRICDTYLASFGGLDAGLPALAGEPAAAAIDGCYPLRHLTRHLEHAGRMDDVNALLAAEHPADETRSVNTWFAASDQGESIVSYLADLARAWSGSAAATDRAVARRLPAAALGLEIRYALMAASMASLTGGISAGLVRQLVGAGMWSSQRGLDHARRIADPRARLDTLLALYDQVDAELRLAVLTQALSAATSVTSDLLRAQALAELAPRLTPDMLAETLAAATAITDDSSRALALAWLAPHLPADQLARAVTAATTITDESARAQALTCLVPHLKPDERPAVLEEALNAASVITDGYARVHAVVRLLPHLNPDERPAVLEEALNAASVITDGYARVHAVVRLVPHLKPDERPAALEEALNAAATITDEFVRGDALTNLAPHLTSDLLARALSAVTAITNNSARVHALTDLAPHLTPDLLPQALAATTVITDERYLLRDYRAEALEGLAPHLTSDLLPEALAAATAVTDDYSRVRVMTELARRQPPVEQPAVLAQVLDAATAITDEYSRAVALTRLVRDLPASEQAAALAQALDAAAAIADGAQRARALTMLAPRLPADLLPQALNAAAAIASDSYFGQMNGPTGRTPRLNPDILPEEVVPEETIKVFPRAQALAGLAPYLTPELLPTALNAAAITDDFSRALALERLALHLAPDERLAVLTQALDAATAITDGASRAKALTALAPHLPPDLLPKALAAAAATTDESHRSNRADALTGLAPYLTPALLARALDIAVTISDHSHRAQALTGLAPHMAADDQHAVLAQALDTVTAIQSENNRAWGLAGLAPQLTPDLLTQALDAAITIADHSHRARAITGLAPHFTADDQPAVLAQALDAATAITDSFTRAGALEELAPHLAADDQTAVLAQALDAATSILNDSGSIVLAGLARLLVPDLQPRALAAATAITDEYSRAQVLAGLATRLSPGLLPQALEAAATITDDFSRADALTALAARVPASEQPAVVAQALNAIAATDKSFRYRTLVELAPLLSPPLLPQALGTATAITDDFSRAMALTGLAPFLPADLLPQALAAIPKTSPEAFIAVLERCRSALAGAGNAIYVNLLRDSLSGTDRKVCLDIITAVTPALAEIGGSRAIEECISAIFDVNRWWR